VTLGPVRHHRVLDGCVEPECLDRIHRMLAELWSADSHIAEVDRTHFETAVIEVAGNIVRHGRSAAGFCCRVVIRVYDSAVEAVFTDSADPVDLAAIDALLDPTADTWPDEMAKHGRGLALARAAVDELTYQRIDQFNQWRVCRVRTE